MKKEFLPSFLSLLIVITLLTQPFAVFAISQPGQDISDTEISTRDRLKTAKISLPFIKNEGQYGLPGEVAYYAKTFSGTAFVTPSGFTYSIPYSSGESTSKDSGLLKHEPVFPDSAYAITESFKNPNNQINTELIKSVENSSTKVSFFMGKDSADWDSSVATANELSLGNVWENIEVTTKAYNNSIEKIYTVFPYGKVSDINMQFGGVQSLEVNERGELVLHTTKGDLTMSNPVAYQNINGKRVDRAVSYSVLSDISYGFNIGEYDHRYPLVIDPLINASYFGGANTLGSFSREIVFDNTGNIYVVGGASETDFPVTAGAYDLSQNGSQDGVVIKISADLTTVLAATYIGGTGTDTVLSAGLDSSGNVFVSGVTSSTVFPTTVGAYDTTDNTGSPDGFVAKFTADLTTLSASTLIGGGNTSAAVLLVDSSDNVYITGSTQSSSYPTIAGGYQVTFGGTRDAFVSKLNSTLTTLIASTFVGGSGDDYSFSMEFDSNGDIYIAGEGNSTNYPTTLGAYQTARAGGYDATISKLTADLTTLSASTYLGGSTGSEDWTYGVAVSSTAVYVVGWTDVSNYPTTTGAYDTTLSGSSDNFIAKFSLDLTSLLKSTLLGGTASESAFSTGSHIIVNNSEEVYVTGATASTDFPTTSGAYDTSSNGSNDIFISKLSSDFTTLLASTYLGGSGSDQANSIIFDSSGNILLAGLADTGAPTTTGAYRLVNAGSEMYVARLSPDLTVDTSLTSINFGLPNGEYSLGKVIPIHVTFNHAVTVTGIPTIELETGDTNRFASYVSGSGTATLVFNYTVQQGDTASDLDYISTSALSGTIKDASNITIPLTLATPGASGSLSYSSSVALVPPAAVILPGGGGGSWVAPWLSVPAPVITTVPENTNTQASSETSVNNSPSIVSVCPTLPNIPNILKLNTVHNSVKILQQILNCKGYFVSVTGAGSINNETTKFGTLTQKAVKAFQESKNLKPDGVIGSITRAELNN